VALPRERAPERDEARARISQLESQLAREREQRLARDASLEQRLDRIELALRERIPAGGNAPWEVSKAQRHGAVAATILTIGLLNGSIVPADRN
jgi:hypothetical protein